jgi:hypothetical protein
MDRNRALQDLQEAATLAERQDDLAELKALFYRIQGIAQQFPQDSEVQAEAKRARQIAVNRGKSIQEQQKAAGVALAGQPAVAAPAPIASPAADPPKPPEAWRWRLPVIAGSLAGMMLAIPIMYSLSRKPIGPPTTDTTQGVVARIKTSPAGAQVRLNGEARGVSDLTLNLPVGDYQVDATLDGYLPASATLRAEFGRPNEIVLPLRPAQQLLRIFSDLDSGTVKLDSTPPQPLEGGQAILENIPPGEHRVFVEGPQGSAGFSIKLTAGGSPEVKPGITTRNLLAIVAGNLGRSTQLQTSDAGPVPVQLDGKPAGSVTAQGLDLQAERGERELLWGTGATQRKVLLAFGPVPTVSAYLKMDLNAGTLVVSSNEDDASVFVDGVELKRKTSRGQLRIANLAVKDYRIRIAKPGFLGVAEQTIRVAKGEETRVTFQLKPEPKVASLNLAGLPPGAAVLLDGQPAGTARPDGTLQIPNLAPGDHAIEVRAERYLPRRTTAKLVAGQTYEIRNFALELAPATLRFNVTPANAKLSIRRDGERDFRAIQGASISVQEGSYTILAQSPDMTDRTVAVQVAAGDARTVEIRLQPAKAPEPVAAKPQGGGIEGFEGAFQREGDWYVKRGGGAALYRPTPGGGTFSFSVFLKKATGVFRTSRIQFFVDYQDPKNFILYQIDDKRIHRIVTVDGKRKGTSLANRLGDLEFYPLQVDVKGDSISLRGRSLEGSVLLDSFTAESDVTDGRFGLQVQGKDEVAIGEFRFTPR